jgi:hypothetical protein
LAVISARVNWPNRRCADPSGVDVVVDVPIAVGVFEDGPSVIIRINLVDSDEVVVISVLVGKKLKLRMKQVLGGKRILSQVFFREFNSFL